jgi:hypothetical protein
MTMIPRRTLLLFAALSALSLGVYLWASQSMYSLGFPLDDAWIHQTYARNLAVRGEWAFQPGVRSGGSTAPLWSGLLGLGVFLTREPYWPAYLLGWLCLWGLALLGYLAFRQLRPASAQVWPVAAGVLLALEWRLVWAAGSGMETPLFALLALGTCAWLAWLTRPGRAESSGRGSAPGKHWVGIGALIGLSVWVRPDGVTLLGAALVVAAFGERGWRGKVGSILRLGTGFLCLFLPYLLFNRIVAGDWWPTTFYAKQAEYAILVNRPLLERVLQQFSLPLVGATVLLLPGFLSGAWTHLRRREWGAFAAALWVLAYLGSYALRLPVTYQHGRYAMPVIPVFCVWGLAGLAGLIQNDSQVFWRRVVSRAWTASLCLAVLAFWGRGAQAYAWDVAVIESEMAAAARWVAQNTGPADLVAAHDIGALGYFTDRRLLDLAGLISPEVIPIMSDELALSRYLDNQGARYLVAFPGWYPTLSSNRRSVYNTEGRFSPALGGENMVVYEWRADFP